VVTDRVAAAEVDNPKWEQTLAQTVARFTALSLYWSQQ
jgi:hypothetical protein